MEGAKKTKQLFFASLCALPSLREIVYFFTASKPWETKPKRRSSPGRGGRTRKSSRVETFSFAPLGLPRTRGPSGPRAGALGYPAGRDRPSGPFPSLPNTLGNTLPPDDAIAEASLLCRTSNAGFMIQHTGGRRQHGPAFASVVRSRMPGKTGRPKEQVYARRF